MDTSNQIYQLFKEGHCNPVYDLSSVLNILLWVSQLYIAISFIIYSYRKLFWTPIQLRTIIEWHEDYPSYFVRLIGVIELLCGLGLVLPYISGIAPVLTIIDVFAMILFMIIAASFHIRRKEYTAIVKEEPHYILLLIFIAWGRLSQYPFISC